jgi:ATP-binding cassette subfamily F protein 3
MKQRDNLLLLDEPTNHLDVYSCEALEQALLSFDGTAVLISHDRYFLDRIATAVLYFRAGGAELIAGNYSEFLEWQERGRAAAPRPAGPAQRDKPAPKTKSPRPPKAGRPQRGRKVEEIEAEIMAKIRTLQTELSSLEAKLKKLYQEYDALGDSGQ